jgi:hypothetical protein
MAGAPPIDHTQAAGTGMLPAFVLLDRVLERLHALTGVEAVSNGVPGVQAAREPERGADADGDGGDVDR